VVTRVYDGDTVVVETVGNVEIDVRLLGINAPDRGECFHNEATDFLIDILEGRSVGLYQTGKDQFGRTLAYVDDNGTLVNLVLVERGFAIATTPGDGEWAGAALLSSESEAFMDDVGLWSDDACGDGFVPFVEIDPELSSPDPPGADGERLGDEIIAFTNRESIAVDLSGWVLRDESSRHRYSFATGTRLAPGGTIAVSSSEPGWEPGGSPVWNNGGDMALLLDRTGRVVARWRY
jgi:hypothetical protein